MGFEEIKSQEKAINLLKAGFRTRRISHAFLFYGPQGVGKGTTAKVFSQLLNCQEPSPDAEPCEKCSSCQKAISGNHPDIIWVEPEGNNIKIGQMRTLQEKAYFKCYEGTYKVIMIDDVQLLTEEAANSLLKVLEEPPANTVFILIAQDSGALPTTLLSRCQSIPFNPLSEQVISAILKEQGKQLNFPLSLAKGSVGRALNLSKKFDGEQFVWNISQLLEGLPTMSYQEIFSWAEKIEKDKELQEASLDVMATIFRDKLVEGVVGDNEELLLGKKDYLAMDLSEQKCLQALQEITKSQQLLNRNANNRLVLEVLLIKLRNIES